MTLGADDRRAQAVAASPSVVGVSHAVTDVVGPGRWRIRLFFIPPATGGQVVKVPLGAEPRNFVVTGPGSGPIGLRIVGVDARSESHQLWLTLESTAGPESQAAIARQTWTVRMVGLVDVDPFFDRTTFHLRTESVSGGTGATGPEPVVWTPEQNYRARDYDALLQVMLERLAVTVPDWTERHPADIGVMIVELLAYLGDDLSYQQDVVATESALITARLRTSLVRHGRLLDYAVSQGTNARTFLHIDIPSSASQDVEIPPGSPFRAPRVATTDSLDDGDIVFETMHGVNVSAARNKFAPYDWGASEWILEKGATSAAVVAFGAQPGTAAPRIAPGDVLVFADMDPVSTNWPVLVTAVSSPETDPLRKMNFVSVSWTAADALPKPFVVTTTVDGHVVTGQSVVFGNNVLADEGKTAAVEAIVPGSPSESVRLLVPGLVWRDPGVATWSARAMLVQSSAASLPCVRLVASVADASTLPDSPAFRVLEAAGDLLGPPGRWQPRQDLIGASPFDHVFVVESNDLRTWTLRFGDGVRGAAPVPGQVLRGAVRTGRGTAGNIGAAMSFTWDVALPRGTQVVSLVAATGGASPEMAAAVRTYAPRQLGVQQRCINEQDFVVAALTVPGVSEASAMLTWVGGFSVAVVAVRLLEDAPLDAVTREMISEVLAARSLAGTRTVVRGPAYVALEIALRVECSADPYSVKTAVELALRPGVSQGVVGFFDPANMHFGASVHLAEVIARVMGVPGVATVEATRFGAVGLAADGVDPGVVSIAKDQIAELRDELGNPRRGFLVLDVQRSA